MKKRRVKRGFTLAEMLISVLLLGLVSMMVAVMTSSILNSTVMMQEIAQAEILGSEALDNVQGQLRTAQNITFDTDGKIKFDLDTNNTDYTLDIREKDGMIILGNKKSEEGALIGEPLFSGVSYGNLKVTKLDFKKTEDSPAIDISVEISYSGRKLWGGSVSVRPLNGIK